MAGETANSNEIVIPSVTRVFSKAKALYIYLRDYDQGDAPVNPLLAYATFYLDGRKAFETTAIESVDATLNRLKTMPLRFSVPLNMLAERHAAPTVSLVISQFKRAIRSLTSHMVFAPFRNSVGAGKDWGLSLATPVIVKYRDDKTDTRTELEQWIR